MPPLKVVTERQFTIYHTLALGVLLGYVCLREPDLRPDSLIYWPGAYFLSLWLLGPLALHFFNTSSGKKRKDFLAYHGWSSGLFGALHFLLSGMLILLLERFFRLPEHYNLPTMGRYAAASWYYAIDGIIWYWTCLVVFVLVYNRQKWLEERQKTEVARLELLNSDLITLRTELNPHFLFNTMNSIAMKVRLKENKLAVAMIASLNDLLRVVLTRRHEKTVSLAEELALLDKYLLIEKTRFGDAVEISREFADDLLPARVPQMLLQPLVENAFKHGIKEKMGQQHIQISGQRNNGTVVLTVYNTTAPQSAGLGQSQSLGIGLQNVVQRLRKLYGTAFHFQRLDLENGVAFKITLPFRT